MKNVLLLLMGITVCSCSSILPDTREGKIESDIPADIRGGTEFNIL